MTSAFSVKREPDMKPDPGQLNLEDERVSLKLKVSELERKLTEERHKFEQLQAESETLGKLSAFKESEKHRRELLSLKEHVRRLEEDVKTLREREAIDRERIEKLLQEIETKDRELNEKSVEFKVANRDLECAMRRAQEEAGEWMNKFSSLKARESILVDEISRLKVKASHSFEKRTDNVIINIDIDDDEEQLPVRTHQESLKRKCQEELPLSTPEPKGQISRLDMATFELLKKQKLATTEAAARVALSKTYSRRHTQSESSSVSRHVGVEDPSTVAEDIQNPISKEITALDQVTDTKVPSFRERCSQNLNTARCAGRTSSEVRQSCVLTRALKLRSELKSGHPSFIKRMVRSQVSGCFWLCLPFKFCLENLPARRMKMILEDEEGVEYEAKYIGDKHGFSVGGWKQFASAHRLEVGDALIFELSGPARFKVYVIKANVEPADKNANEDNISAIKSKSGAR